MDVLAEIFGGQHFRFVSHFARFCHRSLASAFFLNFINKIVIIKLNALLGDIMTQKPHKLPKMFENDGQIQSAKARNRKGPSQSQHPHT